MSGEPGVDPDLSAATGAEHGRRRHGRGGRGLLPGDVIRGPEVDQALPTLNGREGQFLCGQLDQSTAAGAGHGHGLHGRSQRLLVRGDFKTGAAPGAPAGALHLLPQCGQAKRTSSAVIGQDPSTNGPAAVTGLRAVGVIQ